MGIKHRYQLPFIFAACLHGILFIYLFVSFSFPSQPLNLPGKQDKIVQAVTVNQQQVEQEVQRLKQQRAQKEQLRRKHLAQYKNAALAAKKARRDEQRRLAKLKALQKQQQIKQQHAQKVEQARLAKLKQQREQATKELSKLKQQRQQLDQQSKAALTKLTQQQKKLKALQAKAKQQQATAHTAQQKKDADDLLQQQLQAEQQQLSQSRQQYVNSVLDKYKALILNAIAQHWIVPGSVNKDLTCTILVTLAPDGNVLNAHISSSSGQPALDRSAVAAVYKASPLPVPSNPELFNYFKSINLKVRPENLIQAQA